MKVINLLIKILVNFKYKKEHFLSWSWCVDSVHEINIVTAEHYQDHYRYGTREEHYEEKQNDMERNC